MIEMKMNMAAMMLMMVVTNHDEDPLPAFLIVFLLLVADKDRCTLRV